MGIGGVDALCIALSGVHIRNNRSRCHSAFMPAALMLRRAADRLGAELGQAFLHGSRIQSRDIAAYFGINGGRIARR
jgi:hypothetical protein